MSSAFSIQVSENGIAELKFDLPGEKVNKFSEPVLKDLEAALDTLAQNKSIKALKLTSGKEGTFIAGADLRSFEPLFKTPASAGPMILAGHRVFNKLQNLPFPTVAVINGACLGGGLECALSCTYRVVLDNPKTSLGLPEVSLGIFPGWGGTQRLPRLIGLQEGLNMILTGKLVPALKAYKIGIADAIIPWEFEKGKVDAFMSSILTKEGKAAIEKKRNQKGFLNFLLEGNPLGRKLVFYKAREAVMDKTKGRYPAPLIALNVIQETYGLPKTEGLKKEADLFIANIPDGFALSKDLISLFFTSEALKKETGAPSGTQVKQIKSAAILGAGTMGAGIAWLFADHQIFVRLKDISMALVGKGLGVAYGLFKKGLKVRKITQSEADLRFQLISGTTDYSGFQHADLVIEAATENLELKKKIFQELEAKTRNDAIIASNTSSLTIDAMAEGLKYPERFVGIHFFNPVPKMPLVEVVAGKKTSPETLATAVDLCRKLGKTPIVVKDCPGFLVNRIFMVGANEIMLMLEEGYSMEELNQAVLGFGMPMGPFELVDEVGVDVTSKVCDVFEKAYGERMRPAKILHAMCEKGFIGKKTGKGFYIHEGKKQTVNPAVKDLLASIAKPTGNTPKEEILPRFLFAMINEASRCLEENIIERADFLDMALIMGTGFPPFQGGLLRYADKIGSSQVLSTLQKFEKSKGLRFKPSALLQKKGESNGTFYPG